MSCNNFECGQPMHSGTTSVGCSSHNRACQRCLMCYVFKDLTEPPKVEGWAANQEGAERIEDFEDCRKNMLTKLSGKLGDRNSETLHNGDWNMWILDELKRMEEDNVPGHYVLAAPASSPRLEELQIAIQQSHEEAEQKNDQAGSPKGDGNIERPSPK